MEFSIATLLSQFSHHKLMGAKDLKKKLNCQSDEEAEKLEIILDVLEKIGILSKELGKYRTSIDEQFVEAKLRCSSKGFCFAIQDQEDADDIYIRESHLSNAWNGDRVFVKTIKEGNRRRSPEGEVALILDRANPSLLARIKKSGSSYRAVPLDDRLLFEVELDSSDERLQDAIDHLVHVEIRRYPLGTNLPLGRVTKILGSDAEAAADTDIVSCKHDLPQTFSIHTLEAVKSFPKPASTGKIAKSELKNRLDLRSLLTLTLDSEKTLKVEGVPLVENALTLQKLKDGQWQLGIHIADFGHYVEPESAIARDARKRGTAVYLGELILPLYPEAVYRRCCLLPERENLTISVLLTLDSEGNVVEFDIQPSAIKVDAQLTYQQAQTLLQSDESESEMQPVATMLHDLFFVLSPLVRAKRLQRGGFELPLETQYSPYKDDSRLGAIATSSSLPLWSMQAELMVLAGEAIAKHFNALSLPCLYCVQGDPDMMELEDFIKLGNNLGLDLVPELEEEVSPQHYQHFVEQAINSPVPKILTHFLRATLRQRSYSTHPGRNFGLAYTEGYCQCVSPGQRYGDLLVQWLIHTLFDEGRDRRSSRTKAGVNLGSSTAPAEINWNVLPTAVQTHWEQEIAGAIAHLNERDKIAQDAESDLEGLKKAEQMKERTGEVFQGLITGVQSYGFFVEIEELLVEGLVHVSSLKDDWYEYRSRHSCLVGRKYRQAYRLGDRVEVQVKSVDYYRQQIDLVTVSGGSEASSEDLEDE
ncbi:ribonuclease R family protein [Oscillatoria sp. FACHB-1406]|uniref:ribonuclease R family protein n=1 Tax=Oscillatoria sp. FACHB-1406 TaxID=2692846 RepID=UPI0016889F9C|nr:ribonuclease R family protein [Oscillatoria sp. FACHB-1406]MBD2576231.1 VacB/RNase II family 3'-5' exoribonuclease [Oscillatoria sp. FACHB-1406]